MANGDITHIKELGRFTIPGGGFTTAGAAKNNKVMVWGEISGTWVDTNGLRLDNEGFPEALGVSTLDFVNVWVKTTGGNASDDQDLKLAEVDSVTGNIFVVETDADTNPTAGDTVVLGYFAIGDSNAVADLT